eukprot:360656-Chlamydomonas_euryale.AAC.1
MHHTPSGRPSPRVPHAPVRDVPAQLQLSQLTLRPHAVQQAQLVGVRDAAKVERPVVPRKAVRRGRSDRGGFELA